MRTELNPIQDSTIRANFSSRGTFLQSIDIHPMLDCKPDIEKIVIQKSDIGHLEHDMVSLSRPGLLREEFFGGIFCEHGPERIYHLGYDGFKILELLANKPQSLDSLTRSLSLAPDELSRSRVQASLEDLFGAGLLSRGDTAAAVRVVHANAESINYLQVPLVAEIELTHGCFRRCLHCAYESAPDVDVTGNLTAKQWASVFGKLAQSGVFSVQFTGGDPFFRADVFEILEAADDCGLSITLRTDTVAIKESFVDRVKRLRHLAGVSTSIDGKDASEHDWMRGSGAFAVFKTRVAMLASAGIPVTVGATLHKRNYSTVRDMGAISRELGGYRYDIGFLCPVGRGRDLRDLVLDGGEVREAFNQYLDGIAAGEFYSSSAQLNEIASDPARLVQYSDIISELPYLTEWPWSRMRIDPFGNTYTAGKLKGTPLGRGYNVMDHDILTIWHKNPNYSELRTAGNGGRIHGLDIRKLAGSLALAV